LPAKEIDRSFNRMSNRPRSPTTQRKIDAIASERPDPIAAGLCAAPGFCPAHRLFQERENRPFPNKPNLPFPKISGMAVTDLHNSASISNRNQAIWAFALGPSLRHTLAFQNFSSIRWFRG
jgi:hypothetical protein